MGRLRVDRICGRHGVVRVDGAVLVSTCHVADRLPARLVGLLGTRTLAPGEGLWLRPCRSVHTIGMRYPIAVAFLDADGAVVRVVDPLPPNRAASGGRAARQVVEAPAGTLRRLRAGARLLLD